MGQPIRLMLAYAGVDYVDKRYTLGPDMDRSEWLKDKFNLGLDFPNVSLFCYVLFLDTNISYIHDDLFMMYVYDDDDQTSYHTTSKVILN